MQSAPAATPSISSISLHSLQIGKSTQLTIEGANLLPDPYVLMSVPTVGQTLVGTSTATRLTMYVTVDPSVSAGIYLLHVATPGGISGGIPIAVDALAEKPIAATLDSLPIAVSGKINGAELATTSFKGKQGQRVLVDVQSRRLGSALQPSVHIYNSRRVQIGWAQGDSNLAGDARLSVLLPADDTYSIELHDIVYSAAANSFFRLAIGDLKYADVVFPPAIQRGTTRDVRFLSTNLPEGAKVSVRVADGFGPLAIEQPVPWPADVLATGLRPRLLASEYPELLETQSTPGEAQELSAAPVGVCGAISAPGQEDKYKIPVTPGQRVRLQVAARRFGSPLDGVLTVTTQPGAEPLSNDDQGGTQDPGLELKVPEGVNALTVGLRDVRGTGGPAYVYRLSATVPSQPTFALTLQEDRFHVPKDGSGIMRVKLAREGYEGPVKLTFFGLPPNMTLTGETIPAGANETLVTLFAKGLSTSQQIVSVVGESVDVQPVIRRTATVAENVLTRFQPWLRTQAVFGVTPPRAISLELEPPGTAAVLPVGGSLPMKVKVNRAAGIAGPVRLKAISSFHAPTKQIGTNANPQAVEDPDLSLRLAGNPVIAADKNEAEVKIRVPGDLPWMGHDIAVRGELLASDGNRVIDAANSPALRLEARGPITLDLAGAPKVDARAGLGPAGKLQGKISRLPDFKHPVALKLTGLPKGVSSPVITVPAEQDTFEFPLQLAYETPAGEMQGVKLVGTAQPDPNDYKTRLTTNRVPVTVNVVAGEKPKPEKPYEIFEDDELFMKQLIFGNGTMLIADERYSGALALKITADQRYNPRMAGMEIKIRQHPGPGEYRYLQFAWKKQGGSTICFQLAHDGKFGPTPGSPASFRYHTGGTQECYGASISLGLGVPAQFELVTRDLFADFGEFTLTGLALSPVDEVLGIYDHIYLGKTASDFELVKP